MSYGIAQLERQLDVKLLERGLHGAGPTPRGRILLAEAREVIAQADRLRAAGLAFSEQVEPEVSLSVSPIYPLNGRTTLGFTGLDVPVGMVAHLAPPVEMSRVVGPSHVLAGRRGPVSAKELRNHLQLVAMDTSEMADKLSLNVLSPRVWRVADTMIRYQMIVAGVGWTHFVRPSIAADIEAGRLVELRYGKHEVAPRYTPRVFYRAAAPPGPAGRWLIERLCDDVPAPRGRTRPPRRPRRR